VQHVLRQYRAFQEIEEALKVAAGVEQVVSELNVRAGCLAEEIAELESQRAVLLGLAEAARAEIADKRAEAEAEVVAMKEAAAIGVKKAKKALAAIEAEALLAKERGATFIMEGENRLAALKEMANAEEARYASAKAAVESLKASI